MPALKNAKHERFAQELAKGETADAAYENAGYSPNRGNATRLKANESVAARVAEIQGKAAARAEITVASSRGKHVRAEPVAGLYDQNRIRHREQFPLMEAEMLMTTPAGYQGEESPNRMDALVWAVTELKLEAEPSALMLLKKRLRG